MSPRKPADSESTAIDQLLARKVPLSGGIIRAIVSVAENPDDALRTVCMETLIEIGTSSLYSWSVMFCSSYSSYPGSG
jgi:hypothetical protein